MTETFTDFDPADLLDSAEAARVFVTDALETGDAAHVAEALGVVARARGMTELADRTGLSREHLYRSLSESGNPTLKTTLAVMKALGLVLTARSDGPAADRSATA